LDYTVLSVMCNQVPHLVSSRRRMQFLVFGTKTTCPCIQKPAYASAQSMQMTQCRKTPRSILLKS